MIGMALSLAAALWLLAVPAALAAEFNFGAIGAVAGSGAGSSAGIDQALRRALQQSDADNLAFVVVNGIKSAAEPCSDQIYTQRRDLLEQAQNGVVMSLAANDWVTCRNAQGKSAAIERLNQVRELFYDSDLSFGASKLELIRQSATPKFREYAENARWEINDVLFATINLPETNNHYRSDGGRNGEFEDRQIANRNWLQRLFAIASTRKLAAIVLFSDADAMLPGIPRGPAQRAQRDGFLEIRQQLTALSGKFPGRVLLIHAQNEHDRQINWHGNLGTLAIDTGWIKVRVNTAQKTVFYRVDRRND